MIWKCFVCGSKHPIDHEGQIDAESGEVCCCGCNPNKPIRVIKLALGSPPFGAWMGFRADEDCSGLLEEILEHAKEPGPAEPMTITIEDLPARLVAAWGELPGW